MKIKSSRTARAAIAALLLCTGAFEPALAQDLYESPAAAVDEERDQEVAAQALRQRRQEMIDDCEQNNGTDCEREVDTELRAEHLQQGARVIRVRPAR